MKLILKVFNGEADILSDILRPSGGEVRIEEDGSLLIEIDSLVPGEFDPTDVSSVPPIWERVHEFVAITNGAAIVEGVAVPRIELQTVFYIDGSGERVLLPITGKLDIVLPALQSRGPEPAPLIQLGLKDLVAGKVLRLLSREADWVNLYRVYEVIKQEVSEADMVFRGWALDEELRAFRASANKASVTGDHARHGTIDSAIPKDTMSLPMARHVVLRIAKRWLWWRVSEDSRRSTQASVQP